MKRGDLVRVEKPGKPVVSGVVLDTRHRVYDPPKNGLCAEVEVLVNRDDDVRKWYRSRYVFIDRD